MLSLRPSCPVLNEDKAGPDIKVLHVRPGAQPWNGRIGLKRLSVLECTPFNQCVYCAE